MQASSPTSDTTALEQTVFIVDDDEAVRNSLALMLRAIDLRVATYASGSEFLEAYQPQFGGCLVLDVRMRGLGGMELQQVLNQLQCDLPIIFITGHGDVSLAVQAMRAGALDFIEKPFRDQYLIERINQALKVDLDRRRGRLERAAIQARLDHLTPREREVMDRVVQGKSNKVVAGELGLSERTVEIHRAKVMAKVGVKSLPELVSMIARSGPG